MSSKLDPKASGAATLITVRCPADLIAAIDMEVMRLRGLVPGAVFGRSEAVRALIAASMRGGVTDAAFVDSTATQLSLTPAPMPDPKTWQERMFRALRDEIGRKGPIAAVNSHDIVRLVPAALRGVEARSVGHTLSHFSRKGPAYGVRVENLGRSPGEPLHQYRLTAAEA